MYGELEIMLWKQSCSICRHNTEFSWRQRKIMKTLTKTVSEPTAIQLDTYQIQTHSANCLVTKHCSQAAVFLLCVWDVTGLYLQIETGYPEYDLF
jgi:hypothetical protein